MEFDLAIIGAGWAGFNASLRAKELGLKVALIEREKLGGTCLNQGCIPTKALIQSAKIYSLSRKSSTFGIEITNPQINLLKIQERKKIIIQQLSSGMQFMLKGIDFFYGNAEILSNEELKIGGQIQKAKSILIATGSKPIELPNLRFDGKKILSSDDILNLEEIPKSLLIIGGGVIGCEFAGLFSAFGSRVTIVEKMPQLLPGEDTELARKLEANFKKKGIKVNTSTDASSIDLNNFELVLLCIGRAPRNDNLGLEKIGVKLEKNRILVDDYLRTHVSNVYAAGDCTAKIMLAHFAAYQGRIAAENISGINPPKKCDNSVVPNCIFTEPEIASIGLNEQKAKDKNYDFKIDKFDFLGSGMARILDETEGFIKIISDNKTNQILGACIIGTRATELIGILTLAVTNRLKLAQIKETIFAHPTVSEIISEALK